MIAQGVYGCVIQPGLACAKKKAKLNSVSKLFYKTQSGQEELQVVKKIATDVDPTSKFTIKVLDVCDVDLSKKPDIQSMCTSGKLLDKARQIVYEYGGVPMHIAVKKYNPLDVLKSTLELFQGLVTLKASKWIHLDIKPSNVVYNDTNKKLSLIDFGISIRAEMFFTPEIDYIRNHIYAYYPPELHMPINMMALYKHLPVSASNRFFKRVEQDAMKIDVYMWGVTMLECFHTLNIPALDKLISNMIDPNVKTRFTPEKALTAIENFFVF
jgi:serine/threonine protein kinase